MDKKDLIIGVACFFVAGILLYLIAKKQEHYVTPIDIIKPPLRRDMNNFRIHNHYRIPVDVIAILPNMKVTPGKEYEQGIKLAESIPTTLYGEQGNVIDSGYDYFGRGTVVLVYASKNRELIGKGVMNIPVGKTIRALHLGMSSIQDDYSMKSDSIRSPLGGSAIPRLRLVNSSPRTLKLSTVAALNDGTLEPDIIIKPYGSVLYLGQFEKGIPLGVTFKDIEGYLDDYKLDAPGTDLFFGLISDVHELPYSGMKFGGDFDDTIYDVAYPLQLTNMGHHKGSKINREYIPSSW